MKHIILKWKVIFYVYFFLNLLLIAISIYKFNYNTYAIYVFSLIQYWS